MSNLPAKHYLEIYRHRISSAEKKITSPRAETLQQARSLVAALEKINPEEAICLEIVSGGCAFKEVATGRTVGVLLHDLEKA